MTIDYYLDEDDYIDFNLYHIHNSKMGKKILLTQRLIGPAIFLIAIYFGHQLAGLPLIPWIIMMSVSSVLWFLLYPVQIKKSIRKRIVKMLGEGQNKALTGKQQLVLDDEGLHIENAFETKTAKWTSFNRAVKTDKHIYVYDSAVSAYIVKSNDPKIYEFIEKKLKAHMSETI